MSFQDIVSWWPLFAGTGFLILLSVFLVIIIFRCKRPDGKSKPQQKPFKASLPKEQSTALIGSDEVREKLQSEIADLSRALEEKKRELNQASQQREKHTSSSAQPAVRDSSLQDDKRVLEMPPIQPASRTISPPAITIPPPAGSESPQEASQSLLKPALAKSPHGKQDSRQADSSKATQKDLKPPQDSQAHPAQMTPTSGSSARSAPHLAPSPSPGSQRSSGSRSGKQKKPEIPRLRLELVKNPFEKETPVYRPG
mmetsp:Transcript_21500/g.36867  ORF Transcript_21500/g.36867 Transcript_21500/m.36867 type:complete len:255 (+) Transcript_21500:114-878(+)|eukprot:CAMPEP_0196659366 /NCGR_PEP_ID=MMETSP1086-20130531/34548_1 /TAXON_ID=77921 /ORGANISM="Cyanoptyche  gloeocystis , Strain SAG4.97" /LENGTH=254 /DNA_ID=CAMNT_0041993315 /DNA_START=39 /DNA_END=803 /DNA_ORIENTATION=+